MKVVPLAAESLGVRSMATYVECGQVRILIDPGAALGPSRFTLPPADREWEALKRANDRISAYATRSQLIFVSHYHEDHFRYDPGVYEGRTVWAKDSRHMINPNQGRRATELWKSLKTRCRLDSAEGNTCEFPDAILKASPPLAHGVEGTGLGYVVALTMTDRTDGFRFVFASDVQGPASPVVTAYLIREHPHLLYLSGPPTYLERQVGPRAIEQGIANLLRIIEATGCWVILDHHTLRDPRQRAELLSLERLHRDTRLIRPAPNPAGTVAHQEQWRRRIHAADLLPDGPMLGGPTAVPLDHDQIRPGGGSPGLAQRPARDEPPVPEGGARVGRQDLHILVQAPLLVPIVQEQEVSIELLNRPVAGLHPVRSHQHRDRIQPLMEQERLVIPVPPREDRHSKPFGGERLRQVDDERGLSGAAPGEVADAHHRHRKPVGLEKPGAVAQVDRLQAQPVKGLSDFQETSVSSLDHRSSIRSAVRRTAP